MTKSTTTVFIVLAVLVLGVIVFLTYPKQPGAGAPESATTTPTGMTGTPAKTTSSGGTTKFLPTGTSGAAPAIGLSKVLLKDASGVSLYSGVDPSGRIVYKPVPGVDAGTFKALTELDAVEHPATKDGKGVVTSLGAGSVAYYKDKNNVYVLSVFETSASTQTAIEVVQDADPASFASLNSWYGKDKTNVFRLEAPTTGATYTPGSYVWKPYDMIAIPNAAVASFVLVSDPKLNYDAHDKTHAYRKGVEIGGYPQ